VQKQLAAIADSLESAQSRLRSLGDGISEQTWNRHPEANRWSAADCVEHLNLTSRAYVPLIRNASAEARQLRTPVDHYRMDALGWFFSMMVGPMRHLGKIKLVKVKTTPPFVPKGGQSRDALLSEFLRLQSDMITLVRTADGLPLDRVKIVSPFGGRVKYSAYSGLVIVARHQHRHIDQAEEAAGVAAR
jgi:DinB family protein